MTPLRHTMLRALLAAAAGLSGATAFAQAGAPASAPASAADTPLAALPYTPGIDLTAMDLTVDPCTDFYQFACGGWQRDNPIPPDKANWSVFAKMAHDNQRVLWGILDRLATQDDGRTVPQRQIGDAFAACTDDARAQADGGRPLRPALVLIDGMKSRADIPAVLARLQQDTNDDGLLFSFGSAPDYADSSRVIAFASQGGLGLPERDDYFKKDALTRERRAKYLAHVARMFVLMGDSADDAAANAGVVMSIETALARASMSAVEQRDSRALFHPADARRLQSLTPAFDWRSYLAAMGLAGNDRFNVSQPAFFQALDAQLRTRKLDDLKTYLRWHVAHASAPWLSRPFVDENFDFYARTLSGTPQLAPLWQRCVALVDTQLGDALGEEFVRQNFTPEMKERTLRMTRQVQAAMDSEIRSLDWMSAATKAKALEKLHGIIDKIGYPDTWRDYAALEIRRDDLLGNVQRGNAFEVRRKLAKIGKPADRGDWDMSPPTVNADFDPQLNTMNFAAGILQAPLYDARIDDAPNYGDTGVTIGHELTHGFDDDGRRYDAHGNLKDWWTKKDAAEFQKRAACLGDQYSKFIAVDDVHVDSKLTMGEDLADAGGVVLALIAWKAEMALHPEPALTDGFTPEQRFFLGAAQWACGNTRPEEARLRAATDPHSPHRYRVNGVLANFKEFEQAFSCKPGQPMAPVARCRVW